MRQKYRRPLYSMSIAVMLGLFLLAAGCTGTANPNDYETYHSYRDIPGVTKEEIAAVEALKAEHGRFTYGHLTQMESFIRQDGSSAGFTIEWCALLSELFDIPFVPQRYDEWEDLKNAIDTRSTDFSGEFTRTPERLEQYVMTYPIAGHTLSLYTLRGNDLFQTEADINGSRVGFWKNSVILELVQTHYPALHFDAIEIVSFADAVNKLQRGEVDAFVMEGSSDAALEGYDFLESKDFFPLAYTTVAMTTADTALAPVISVVNKYMTSGGIHELFTLYEEGRFEYARYRLWQSFDNEERAWLEQMKDQPVRVGYEAENYPVCFYNANDESYQGIALDVLAQVSRLTGLTFESAAAPDTRWPDILDKLRTGEIAMTPELLYSEARENDYLWGRDPYVVSYYALISKVEYQKLEPHQLVWARIGTIKQTAHEDIFMRWFPDLNTTRFDTMAEALSALETGRIDMLMMSEHSLLTQTHFLEKPGYKINIGFNVPQESFFGYNQDQTMLRDVIDKAQQFIDTSSIAEGWSNRVYDYEKKLSGVRFTYMSILAVVLAVILITVSGLLILTRRLSANLTIQEAKLKKAAAEAEEASRAKSVFLANMSHELRTPMNSIVGFSSLAMDSGVSAAAREYLENVRINSDILLQTIDDILDISKIEAGRLDLEHIPFDLIEVIQVCKMVITPKAAEKGITLFSYVEPSAKYRLIGDPTRLRQALLNLLSNAVKFTQKGMVRLTVALEREEAETAYLRFEVRDSGVGMTPEQIARIFKPFKQGDDSTTRRFGGTGLGLTITRSIVEMMGGQLTVHSLPGLGSRFSFMVPFAFVEGKDITEVEALPEVTERPIFNAEVLVCEDNAMNRQVISQYLKRAGLDAVIAQDGLEGLEIVKRRMDSGIEPFDLILMDIHMPVMDGLEAAKNIIALGCRTPIVAMTANIMEQDREAYRANGMPDYISKPFKTQALWDCLMKHLVPVGYREEEGDKSYDERQIERLARMFDRDHANDAEVIRMSVHEGDIKRAHRLAHTLKSAATLAGRTRLSEAAGAVEHALSGGRTDIDPALLDILDEAHKASFEEKLPEPDMPEAAEKSHTAMKPEALRLLQRLDQLLAKSDTDCQDMIDDLRLIPGTDKLIDQLEAYDFGPARDTVAGMLGDV